MRAAARKTQPPHGCACCCMDMMGGIHWVLVMNLLETGPLVNTMKKIKLTFGLIILLGLIWAWTAGDALAQNGASRLYNNGCVIREWENEANPQYRENNPGRCQALDKSLDGGDGPNRGRVRGNFPTPRAVPMKKRGQ